MIELTPFLKSLITQPGLSGYESPVREVIAETWHHYVDEISVSRLGSLHGLSRGNGEVPRRRILVATHMDAIGLMVSGVVDGLLRITEVGGVDHRILPGQAVLVHGKRPLPGVVIQPPAYLLPSGYDDKPVDMNYLLVDTGLLPDEVLELVRVGDLVSFDQEPLEMSGDALAGHSLDNRASVAALTLCLDELQHMRHTWDVWAVASAQEEETLGGALTSTFAIRPDLAIAIDVTHAKGPGASDYRASPLEKGVVLGLGPNIHPAMHKQFKDLADQLDIPTVVEPMSGHSGTDAIAIQVAAEGVPTMVISIPLRYMHTPVELVSLKDIRRTAHLLAEYIARLDADTFESVRWED